MSELGRWLLYGGLTTMLLMGVLNGCRTSRPPAISVICIGDGFGGADCVTAAGAKQYKSPTDLKDFWMTTQVDEANFSAWCYDAPVSSVKPVMKAIEAKARP